MNVNYAKFQKSLIVEFQGTYLKNFKNDGVPLIFLQVFNVNCFN